MKSQRDDMAELDEMIYEVVQQIPRGKISTYGAIGKLCGMIRQARRVGYALRRLPAKSGVPWHRVINAQGTISFPKGSGGYQRQKALLMKEGIRFHGECVDLERHLWPKHLPKTLSSLR